MKNLTNLVIQLLLIGGLTISISCNPNQKNKTAETMNTYEKGTYGYDLQFLQKHKKPVELKSGDARVLIAPEYQGRVMTSSAGGESGKSYGLD
jgi:hypothetical protein